MPAQESKLQIPYVKNIRSYASPDGKAFAFGVTTKDGQTHAFAFTPDDASKLLTMVVELVQQAGAERTVPLPPSAITVHPFDVSAIGIEQGRSPTEVILSIQFGPIQMSFALQLQTLLEQLERLHSRISVVPSKPN
jgi:hypothetical protein